MPLPPSEPDGNLPPGVHKATLPHVVARFGSGTTQRKDVTARLLRIYELAQATGYLERFIFGSYITSKPVPNDVDVILVMSDDFCLEHCDHDTLAAFDAVFGNSGRVCRWMAKDTRRNTTGYY